jgi:hypothetical protein
MASFGGLRVLVCGTLLHVKAVLSCYNYGAPDYAECSAAHDTAPGRNERLPMADGRFGQAS